MQIKFLSKKPEEGNVISFQFEKPENLEYQAGQFFRYNIPNSDPDDRGVNRFFTNSAAPFENKIQISTRIEEDKRSSFKTDLSNLEPGDTIETEGPKGKFVLGNPQKKYIFIAGGIGVTPFRSILLQLDHDNEPLNIILIYATSDKNPFFHDELNNLAEKHPEFKIYYVVSDESVKEEKLGENIEIVTGKINEDLIKKLVPDYKGYIFYTSGPELIVEDLEKKWSDIGISEENSIRDYFPGYTKY